MSAPHRHPERSEEPHKSFGVTLTTSRDQRTWVGSLAVCATRDDARGRNRGRDANRGCCRGLGITRVSRANASPARTSFGVSPKQSFQKSLRWRGRHRQHAKRVRYPEMPE
jgi:hypothetical protein